MPLSGIKRVSGLLALVSLACLVVVFGRPLLARMALPLPSLSLGKGFSLAGVKVASYQENPTLYLPSIGLEVPIIKNVSVTDADQYDDALTKGVGQGAGSAALDSSSGNTVIFGHSSALGWKSNPYDTVFANLPSIKSGDSVQIITGGRTDTFTVQESKVIEAREVQYLNATSDRTVTLITCWPLGTNAKRWVVRATKAL